MTEDDFWAIIAALDWDETGDDHAVLAPAVAMLAARPVEDIEAFSELMAGYLYALDTREHARYGHLGEADPDDPDDYISADGFLYLRCVVVANGREFFDQVLADPREMPRDLEFEALLSLDREAYSTKTGEEYDFDTELSYESFSNDKGWAPTGATRDGLFTSGSIPPGNRRPGLADPQTT